MIAKEKINFIVATDCGSTTTKAILIQQVNGEFRQTHRGEAPTTVEAPFDDVTIGVRNAVTELEELSGRKILKDDKIMRPAHGQEGVDIYLSTSSAGGGLQMMVTGVIRSMTAQSAQQAALGAGAIVMETLSVDDGRQQYERIAQIRHLRPDILLISGGTDGGTTKHPIEMAETIIAADPRPRFGTNFRLPVIYAGNKEAGPEIDRLLGHKMALKIVDNLRPTLESDNLQPARNAIHDVFLEHVMAHAPGYDKLISWADADIMSTPAAVGLIIQEIARQYKYSVLAVDIGGATTDVFSVFEYRQDAYKEAESIFNRTVSANLGMSYSICNVLREAGIDNIMRWLPHKYDKKEIKNRLRNKMIRPTTIPQTLEDLLLEHAVSREALRLAFDHHKMLAVGRSGAQKVRSIGDVFEQKSSGETIVDLMHLDMIVGSGGVLSHAPKRHQSALMMIDAYQPEGFTFLAVDSIFMMPQLGVLTQVHPEAAAQVFEKDCIVYLGTVIAPKGEAKKPGKPIAKYTIIGPKGAIAENQELLTGEMKVYPLAIGETAEVTINPYGGYDVGFGPGKSGKKTVKGGVVGVMLDGRGRPLVLSDNEEERVKKHREWLTAFGLPY